MGLPILLRYMYTMSNNMCALNQLMLTPFISPNVGCFILKSKHYITTKQVCKKHIYIHVINFNNSIMHEFPSHFFLHESMLLKSSRNDNLLHFCDDKIQIILPQWPMCCFTLSNSKCALLPHSWTLSLCLSLHQ